MMLVVRFNTNPFDIAVEFFKISSLQSLFSMQKQSISFRQTQNKVKWMCCDSEDLSLECIWNYIQWKVLNGLGIKFTTFCWRFFILLIQLNKYSVWLLSDDLSNWIIIISFVNWTKYRRTLQHNLKF